MSPALVLYLGLANWLVTLIVVESELCRPLRERAAGSRLPTLREVWRALPDEALRSPDIGSELQRIKTTPVPRRPKLAYLVSCHLCAGTWVGLAMALVAGSPFPGLAGVVLGGLTYKALGHVTLEATAALQRVGA